MALVLPQPNEVFPATEVNPRLLIIYGPPKIGKTTLLKQLNGCLDLDLEDGTKYLNMLKLKINNIREYIEFCNMMKTPTAPKYKYIAVDTIDALEEWCEETATLVYKASSMGSSFKGKSVLELPNGGGYRWLRHEVLKYLNMIQECCKYIILVGHIRDKALVAGDKILQADGSFATVQADTVSAKDLDLTGKVKSIVCSRADAIGHVYRDTNGVLCISFQGKETVNCGSRCDHLKGKNFVFDDWNKIYLPAPVTTP